MKNHDLGAFMCLLVPRIKQANPSEPRFFFNENGCSSSSDGHESMRSSLRCEFLVTMEDSLTHSLTHSLWAGGGFSELPWLHSEDWRTD